jgi:hypothetical protein
LLVVEGSGAAEGAVRRRANRIETFAVGDVAALESLLDSIG